MISWEFGADISESCEEIGSKVWKNYKPGAWDPSANYCHAKWKTMIIMGQTQEAETGVGIKGGTCVHFLSPPSRSPCTTLCLPSSTGSSWLSKSVFHQAPHQHSQSKIWRSGLIWDELSWILDIKYTEHSKGRLHNWLDFRKLNRKINFRILYVIKMKSPLLLDNLGISHDVMPMLLCWAFGHVILPIILCEKWAKISLQFPPEMESDWSLSELGPAW